MLRCGVPEPLIEIAGRNKFDMVRFAWHIGNRHADVQVVGEKLRIRRDHVLEDMLHHGRSADANRCGVQPGDSDHGSNDLADKRAIPIENACGSAALYRLMSWLSPAYPVGAFSYSGGLEWAVEAGDIKNLGTPAGLVERPPRARRWLL